jgi:hypothetical protein
MTIIVQWDYRVCAVLSRMNVTNCLYQKRNAGRTTHAQKNTTDQWESRYFFSSSVYGIKSNKCRDYQ